MRRVFVPDNSRTKMFKNKFKHYIETHMHDLDSMDPMFTLFHDFICEDLKVNHKELYDDFMESFEEIADELTDDEIEMAVGSIHRKDGIPGPKWTKEETTSVANQFNVKEKSIKKFTDSEFWFAMNYAFATHATPNKTISVYIELALDELFDKNVCFKDKIRILNEKHKEEIII